MSNQSTDSRDVAAFVSEAMYSYAGEVNINRAIPDYRDGLKPVQRIIMWQMLQSKLWPNAKHMKLAKLSGLCMTYHPHADGSISAAAMVLSQEWSKRVPLIDIQGNNGSIDGSRGAAPRYVEARMSPAAKLLFDSVDEDAVDLVDNYDATAKIAEVLPTSLPMLMINGAVGVGYGAATSILPHNPAELLKLIKLCLNNTLNAESAKRVYNGPDFPTGGKIIGDYTQELESSSATYEVLADINVVGNTLVISSTPYGTDTTKLISSLAAVIESHNITAVSDIFDNSGGSDTDIVIAFKRGTPSDVITATKAVLERRSLASCKISANNVVVDNGKLKRVTMLEYIAMFTGFKLSTLKRVGAFRLHKAEDRLEIINAELKAIDELDYVKRAIEKSLSKTDLIDALRAEPLQLTEHQAKHVAAMSLASLVKAPDRVTSLRDERGKLLEAVTEYQSLVDSDAYRRKYLLKRVEELIADMEDAFPRKTTVGYKQPERDIFVRTENAAETPEHITIRFEIGGANIDTSSRDTEGWQKIDCMSTDKVIALTSGGHVIQTLAKNIEPGRVARLYKNISADEHFIWAGVYKPGLTVTTASKRGYMKRVRLDRCVPSKMTTRNSRIGHMFSGIKPNDEIVCINVDAPDEALLSIALSVDSPKARYKSQSIDPERIVNRDDGPSSSGARYIRTGDGAWPITAMIVTTTR